MTSKRKYVVQVSEGGHQYTDTITIDVLMSRSKANKFEYEFIYSMKDMLDAILDLRDGEVLPFKPNRDNNLAHGIITRKDD